MTIADAIIIGFLQGLTEFLPVSSSAHIVLGEVLLGTTSSESLAFAIVIHFATVLSTLIVFRQFIQDTFRGLFNTEWNEAKKFALHVVLSMIPVTIVGLLFRDSVEAMFNGQVLLVGGALWVTGTLLLMTGLLAKENAGPVTAAKAFIVGIAQAVAVIPGISRSGSTIATGLLLGIDKKKMARFSFLMVIPPITGIMLLDAIDMYEQSQSGGISLDIGVMIAGFLTAFATGWVACKWMVQIVQRGKLQYFAYYCYLVGGIAILYALIA